MSKSNKSKLVQSAQKYISKGQYKKAIGEYEKIVKDDPDDIRARLKLADLYYRQKDIKQSVETFVECAKFYENQGFTQKAVAVYKQVIGIDPQRPDLYTAIAINYQKLGLLNDAAMQFDGALKLLDKAGDQVGKLNVIRQMLEMDPDNLPDRIRLAEEFVNVGKKTDAIREFRSVIDALEKLGNRKAYQKVAERLFYHKPDDADVAKKLGAAYVDDDQPERALPKLKVAYKARPHDLEVLDLVASAFDQLGQTHKAITVYREMARLYRQSGLETELNETYSKILALDPTDESARRALGANESDVDGQTIEFDEDAGRPRQAAPAKSAPTAARVGAAKSSSQGDDDLLDAMIAQAAGIPQKPKPQPPKPKSPPKVPPKARRPQQPAARRVKPAIPSSPPPPRAKVPTTPPKPPPAKAPPQPKPSPPPPKPAAKAPPKAPAKAPESLDDDDLDWDDDDDVGFGDGAEQTLVDNLFIPADVLKQVQDGMDWSKPEDDDLSPEERKLREESRELEFYISNGLKDEASNLLKELRDKYGDHPLVLGLAQQVEGMK